MSGYVIEFNTQFNNNVNGSHNLNLTIYEYNPLQYSQIPN